MLQSLSYQTAQNQKLISLHTVQYTHRKIFQIKVVDLNEIYILLYTEFCTANRYWKHRYVRYELCVKQC